jgi:quercetin dioxygenase-like cupin family protein
MGSKIPLELSGYFRESDFLEYPFVSIPQSFLDSRGEIKNLADGVIGDVALITSNTGAIRANHYHQNDWHLCYLLSGKMKYFWSENLGDQKFGSTEVGSGEMVFTPMKSPHKIEFLENSVFLSISKLSRISEKYDEDTFKLHENHFSA